MPPLFSIILPVYNTEAFLEEAIDSILSQSVKDWEIIAINDFSKDNSLEILMDYATRDSRINIFNFSSNQGLGRVRNFAVNRAKGDYLVFLDSDDFLITGSLAVLEECIINDAEADVFIWGFSTYVNGRVKRTYIPSEPDVLENETPFELALLDRKGYAPYAWVNIVKRNLVLRHKIRFAEDMYFEDIQFSTGILFYAQKIVVIKKSYYRYRKHSASITSQSSKQKIDDKFAAFNGIKTFLQEKGVFEKYNSLFLARFLALCVYTCFNEYFMLPKSERDKELDDYMRKIRNSKLLRKENLQLLRNIALSVPNSEKSFRKAYLGAYYGLTAIQKRYVLHRSMVRFFGWVYRKINKLNI